MKKTIFIIIALILVLCTASCNVIITNPTTDTAAGDATTVPDGTDTDAETAEEKVYPHSNMELAPLDEIIATYEDTKFDVATFKYFFMDEYTSFVSQYYYYLPSYGFDESVPLHDQVYPGDDTNTTWYQIFLNRGKNAFEQYAKFAVMAQKEGISLDENEKAVVKDTLDSIENAAKDSSMTFEEYMGQFMGEGMTRERVQKAIELMRLGYVYYEKIYNEPVYTEEQINAEYKKGAGKYSLVDYYETSVVALYDETDSDESAEAAKKAALEKAEKIKEALVSGKSFAEAAASVEEPSEEDPATDNDYLYEHAGYSDSEKYAFLYADGTKPGDVNIYTDEAGNAYVIQCVKAPYKDTSKTISVRHILLDSTAYEKEEDAYAQAQKLLEQINGASDKKAEFIKLVAEYSTDSGSKSTGGLYERVSPGQMVTEFNDWCFDEERKEGDTDIVKTSYGYHVMYFEGHGEELWYFNCDTALRDADFTAKEQDIYETVVFTYNEELLDKITK